MIHLYIDITMFPPIWAVLSILLDTQNKKLPNVQLFQVEYNRYYDDRNKEYMEKLEMQAIKIQTCIHDTVAHDFDSVSDYIANGLTL